MSGELPLPDGPVARYSARVQAAQKRYSDIMDGYWKQVIAGTMTYAEYYSHWGEDDPAYVECRAAIDAATAEYDAR